MGSLDKITLERKNIKKKIRHIEQEIDKLERKKNIEKKYSHKKTEELESEIAHLMIDKRNLIKQLKKIEKEISKMKT